MLMTVVISATARGVQSRDRTRRSVEPVMTYDRHRVRPCNIQYRPLNYDVTYPKVPAVTLCLATPCIHAARARLSLTVHGPSGGSEWMLRPRLSGPAPWISLQFTSRCSRVLPPTWGRDSNPFAVLDPKYRVRERAVSQWFLPNPARASSVVRGRVAPPICVQTFLPTWASGDRCERGLRATASYTSIFAV